MDNRFTNVNLDLQLNRLASVLRLTRLDSISPDRTQIVITIDHRPVNLAPLLDRDSVDRMRPPFPTPRQSRASHLFREVVGLDEIVGDMVGLRGIIVPTVIIYAIHTRVSERSLVHTCSWTCVFGSSFVGAIATVILGFTLNQDEITLLCMIYILKTLIVRTCGWGYVVGGCVIGTVVGCVLGVVLFGGVLFEDFV
jgi:hypothetical protein